MTYGNEWTGGPAQALCAIHPTVPASATCARCGNYACDECTEAGRFDVCPTCRERLGLGAFPFTRDEWSVGGLFNLCWERFLQHWAMLLLASVVLFAVSVGFSFIFQLLTPLFQDSTAGLVGFMAVSQIVQTVVNLLVQLGMIVICIDVVLGRGVRLERLGRALALLPKALAQYLLVILGFWLPIAGVVALPLLVLDETDTAALVVLGAVAVLAFPMIYVSLGLVFMQYELVHDDGAGIISSITRSWQLARGQRWYIFGVGLLAGLIILAGLLLCCVGILVTYPLGSLLFAALYLTMRNGSGLPEPRQSV